WFTVTRGLLGGSGCGSKACAVPEASPNAGGSVVAAPQVKRACAATDPNNSGCSGRDETVADLRK
ncbi:MAG TPA: hypothetical protein VHJ79_05870, partial [Mycobacterium sp.]|nr:hypothetical protein [Mycobacterium sp.]